MRQVLHIRARASLYAIQATISHTRAKRLALVFPLGAESALAAETLEALANSCRATGVDVAIIGGDEALRAAAVAAGFAVATTLDEWETGTMPAMRSVRVHHNAEWQRPQLRLVGKEEGDELDALDPEWEDEPPQYVVELMVRDGVYPGADAEGLAPAPVKPPVSDDEHIRREAERYEEQMTGQIRRTGGEPSRPVSGTLGMPLAPDSTGHSGGETESL